MLCRALSGVWKNALSLAVNIGCTKARKKRGEHRSILTSPRTNLACYREDKSLSQIVLHDAVSHTHLPENLGRRNPSARRGQIKRQKQDKHTRLVNRKTQEQET